MASKNIVKNKELWYNSRVEWFDAEEEFLPYLKQPQKMNIFTILWELMKRNVK